MGVTFHPHNERELPLAQWTYELTLKGMAYVELELFGHYVELEVSYPRWRWLKRRYYSRLATNALTRQKALQAELDSQEQGHLRAI